MSPGGIVQPRPTSNGTHQPSRTDAAGPRAGAGPHAQTIRAVTHRGAGAGAGDATGAPACTGWTCRYGATCGCAARPCCPTAARSASQRPGRMTVRPAPETVLCLSLAHGAGTVIRLAWRVLTGRAGMGWCRGWADRGRKAPRVAGHWPLPRPGHGEPSPCIRRGPDAPCAQDAADAAPPGLPGMT